MSEYRDLLDQESERFRLTPGALDRQYRRRRRRQRNRRLGAGALALVLAVGGTWLVVEVFGRLRPGPRPAEEPRIIQTLSVDSRPGAVAVGAGALWVASPADGIVLRLHPDTGEVQARIALPSGLGPPVSVLVAGGSVWVQTGFEVPPERAVVTPRVVRIDPGTDQVVGTFALGHSEHVPVVVGAGSVWSANAEIGVISERDPETGRVVATVQGPPIPHALSYEDGALWVLGRGRADVEPPVPGELARIDPRTGSVTASTTIGESPRSLGVDEGATWVVSRPGTLFRVDAETGLVSAELALRGVPGQVVVGSGGVWVLEDANDALLRIDPDEVRVTSSLHVGPDPVAIAAGEGVVWVARADGSILQIRP